MKIIVAITGASGAIYARRTLEHLLESEQVERIVMEEMEKAFQMQVPLVADSGWGTNWLEAH